MNWLKRLAAGTSYSFPFQKRCALCRQKKQGMRKYRNDEGKIIFICPTCVEYAERRAFRKL
ncbi:hypothetical protein E4665_09085 [Sporolactobacillus shoreae]|uniref:Uncharacterized protein n=1 Tax=Sporolactobacillus shoreae TaxID=1465501 RepID=A0A4Z0GM31_9BACL|nr:hypothetical protein [Sporolactobacillus shoreae]TGA98099.1 hypothetical protein E4665_09085 [Sporolactobacillus shoreae]